jgi:hypothetical protein
VLLQRRQAERTGAKWPEEASLRPLIEKLSRVAASPAELTEVARYHAEHRKPGIGLSFAERAIRLDPTCATCQDVYSVLQRAPQRVLRDDGPVPERIGDLHAQGEELALERAL